MSGHTMYRHRQRNCTFELFVHWTFHLPVQAHCLPVLLHTIIRTDHTNRESIEATCQGIMGLRPKETPRGY